MTGRFLPTTTRARYAAAVLSGLAVAASAPFNDWSGLVWIGLVPLLLAIRDRSLPSVFGLSFLSGIVLYGAAFPWLAFTFLQLPSLSPAVSFLAFSVTIVLFALALATALTLARFVSGRLGLPSWVALPVVWVGVEWLGNLAPLGIAWSSLAHALYRNLHLMQVCEVTGVYGLSGLIVLSNAVVATWLGAGANGKRGPVTGLAVLAVLLVAILGFGSVRLAGLEQDAGSHSLKIGFVPGHVPQHVRWDPRFLPIVFQRFGVRTADVARAGAELALWPETALPIVFQPEDRYPAALRTDREYRRRVLELADRVGVPLLLGTTAIEQHEGLVTRTNRVYLVSGEGEILDRYDKLQLAPWGEFEPFRLFAGRNPGLVTGYVQGRRQTLFDVASTKLAVFICYETLFPRLVRRAVEEGAEVLVNPTNDAWFAGAVARTQLAAVARFRTVETRRPVVRIANGGPSGVIDITGDFEPISEENSFVREVRWSRERTLFVRAGGWLGWSSLILLGASVTAAVAAKRREGSPGTSGPAEEAQSRTPP